MSICKYRASTFPIQTGMERMDLRCRPGNHLHGAGDWCWEKGKCREVRAEVQRIPTSSGKSEKKEASRKRHNPEFSRLWVEVIHVPKTEKNRGEQVKRKLNEDKTA